MPQRRIDFDEEQYIELEDVFFSLDRAIAREDFEYWEKEEYLELIRYARDYLQGLIEEVEDAEDVE